jgi:hypothetical protein
VLNADGLRYDDEFVKHKILDAMGDLYIMGKPLLAAYSAFRSGHALNNKLLRELLAHTGRLRGRHLRGREKRARAVSPKWHAPGRRQGAQHPMLLFRWAILLLLLVAGVAFAFYAGTGQASTSASAGSC